MTKALIIIDMQPYFDYKGSVSAIIDACRREIQNAINENIPVVLVEWFGLGATDARLRELVENYHNLITVNKNDDDGSNEIVAELGKYNYSLFKVCGVNTDACVKATVKGLIDLCPNLNVEVVLDAVNSDSIQIDATIVMKNLARVRVI